MIKFRKKSTLGKKVICIDDTGNAILKKGTIYIIEKYSINRRMIVTKEYPDLWFFSHRFKEVSE
jgi:hypothetical protein